MANESKERKLRESFVGKLINQTKDNLLDSSFNPNIWSDLKSKWRKK